MKTILDFMPQVEKALGYGSDYTVEEMAVEILEGRAQLWQEGEAMIVTQLDESPRGPSVYFWVAAGQLDDVLALATKVYDWAREIGCYKATFVGRRGWRKPLADHGWTADDRLLLFTKEL